MAFADQQYGELRTNLLARVPALAARLPAAPPPAPPAQSRAGVLDALRQAVATRNESILAIGWGDGQLAELIANDAVVIRRMISIVILPGEDLAFAHALTRPWFRALTASQHVQFHWADSLDGARLVITRVFGSHADIVRLAGTSLIDSHPLAPGPAAERTAWMPDIRKAIVERLDCLGNDVHDTFLGAKHAIMNGRDMLAFPRTDSLIGLHRGGSAICIASGPSAKPHFDRIREIQHEHVVICTDSILGGLLDRGIEPDYVCMVERPEEMVKLVGGPAARCRTRLVALPVVHPASIKAFDGRVVWWWNSDDLYPWLDPVQPRLNSGRSAGTHTVALAGILGVSTAWLVGHDLAFHEGRSHAEGTSDFSVQSQADATKLMAENHPNYHFRRFRVPRNGGGLVETSGVWEIFRSDLEHIIAAAPETRFVNPNINAGVGAIIRGTVAGDMPAATGTAIDKPRPGRAFDEAAWTAYRAHCLALADDFTAISAGCTAIERELAALRPLQIDAAGAERFAQRLNICEMASEPNRILIAYIFRAALRNLMVKLHHNTFVRTMPERTWNQIQVIRMYAATMPPLIARLKAELDTALEGMR